MWFVAAILILTAPDPAADSLQASPQVVPETALWHYLQGRLLEERGAGQEALGNLYRASVQDPRSPAIARRVSQVAGSVGDLAQSLEAADRSLALDPGNPRGLWLRGTALFHLGRSAESLESLQGAVRGDSTNPEFARTLGRVAEHLDRVDLVAEANTTLLKADPADGDAWFELAAAEAQRGRFAPAAKALERAMELVPFRPGILFLDGFVAEGSGRFEHAAEQYRNHLRHHPSDLATRQRLVPLLARMERWEDAFQEARSLASIRPADPDLAAMVAEFGFKSGRTKEAEEVLARLRKSAGDDPRDLSRVLTVMARSGKESEAIEQADRWGAARPGDMRGALLSAQVRAMAGKPADGVPHARRAVEMAPDTVVTWAVLGSLLNDAKRFEEAAVVWRDAAGRFPGQPRLALEVSFSLERHGDVAGAEQAVRDVLARWPDDAAALNSLGYLLADQNRELEEAVRLIARALEKEPANGAYVDSLGWVYYRLGRLAEAREQLERAVGLTGGDPVVREHLGDVYKDLRLMDLAKEQYRLSLAADETNARVRAKLADTP